MGLGSLVKNVFGGDGILSRFAESKLGKIALTAAAIYVGYGVATQGAAFFGGASTAAGGVGVAGGTAAGGAGSAGLATAAPVGTGTVLAPAATTTAVAPSAASIAPVGTGTVLAPTAAPAVAGQGAISSALNTAPSALNAAPEVLTTEPGFMSKVGGFIEKNPMASYGMMNLGGGMISSALAPNPVDEQIRLEAARQSQNRIAGYGGGSGGEPVRIGNRTYM